MHRYVVIDAFASEPLQGNPVAVFFDCDDLSGERMQRMAREMNLSESTFVLRPQQDGDARIRIFTPVNELPFAGHPLLGTAIALGAETDKDRLFLETRMGTVPFALERQDGKVVACSMQQPIPTWEHFSRPAELLAALGLKGSTFPIEVYRNGPRHVRRPGERRRAVRAAPRPPRAVRLPGPGGELLRRRRAALAQPCSRRPTAWSRTPPPVPPPGRWRSTWRAIGRSLRAADRDPPGRRDRPAVAHVRPRRGRRRAGLGGGSVGQRRGLRRRPGLPVNGQNGGTP